MQRKQFPPTHIDPLGMAGAKETEHASGDEEDEEDFDLVEVMNEMALHERRKVYALKGLWNEYKSARAKFRDELALLQIEHLCAAQRLHNVRADIVRGVRDITDEELAAVSEKKTSGVCEISSDDEDGDHTNAAGDVKGTKSVRVVAPQEEKSRLEAAAAAPDGGIPDFWLTAMGNSEVFHSMITERDRHALGFLQDIVLEHIDGDPKKGVRLNFHFAPNEYFTNAVLSKTYCMSFDESSGEVEIDSMKATPVEWKSPEKNLTVIIKSKKQRHKNSKNIRVVKCEEKCPSFFNFFTDPLSEDDEDEEEEDEEDEEVAELHVEAGQALMEEIVPKAAFYYTGKSVERTAQALQSQLEFHAMDDSEDEDDDDDDNDNCKATGKGASKRAGGRGSGSGSGRGQQQQECKQQ